MCYYYYYYFYLLIFLHVLLAGESTLEQQARSSIQEKVVNCIFIS